MTEILILLLATGLGGGGWFFHRQATASGDGDTLALPGSQDMIAGYRRDLRLLGLLYTAIAGTSVVLLTSSGVSEVQAGDETASIMRLVLGGLIGGLPALPLLAVGHFGTSLALRPALPHDTDDDVAAADRGPVRLAMAIGVTAFTGAALYGVYHMSNLTKNLGFDGKIFGLIPPAWFIPFSVEFLLLFILVAKMVREADLAAVVPRAVATLDTEMSGQLDMQRIGGEILAGKTEQGRIRRQADQDAETEAEKFKAAAKTRKARARATAERELKLEQLEGDATYAEREDVTKARIAEIKRNRDIRSRQAALTTQALEAGDQMRAELEQAKVLDRIRLEQDQHQAQLAFDRDQHQAKLASKRSKLPTIGTGSNATEDADPKALYPPADLNGNGHREPSLNGTNGAH